MDGIHKPVLISEIFEYLSPKPGQRFVDATADGGGHVMDVLERIVPEGRLLGIEWDSQLLENLKFKIENLKLSQNVVLVNDSYVNLKKISEENGFEGVDGVLFDLGMSSWHVDVAGRGFTFQKEEPLDMRYGNTEGGLTAEDIVNHWSYDDLAKIFKEYGEERFAKLIAARIVRSRRELRIKTTFQLVEIIKSAVPFWYRRGRIHFATRSFQAIRIAVNDELNNVKSGLEQSVDVLGIGGRLAVISFHSLEDRIVKNFMRSLASDGQVEIITKKPVIAGLSEITVNPRARSAKLRIAQKLTERNASV